MKHAEFIRIRESGTAILFTHGIIGTPRQFDFLIKEIPENYSIYNMLLSGHGKGVKDFSKTNMKNWEKEVSEALAFLRKDHGKIYICAHSMGTLLAIDEILADKSKIEGLLLLQIPLYVKLAPKMIKDIFTILFGKIKEGSSAYYTEKSYSIEKDRRLWLYFGWLPRYIELFIKKRKVRKSLNKLNCDLVLKTLAFQSKKDELVKRHSYRYLTEKTGIKTYLLNSSGHFHYESDDEALVKEKFNEMIK